MASRIQDMNTGDDDIIAINLGNNDAPTATVDLYFW